MPEELENLNVPKPNAPEPVVPEPVVPINIVATIDTIKALTDKLRDITDNLSPYLIVSDNKNLIARQEKDVVQAIDISAKIVEQATELNKYLSVLPIKPA